MESQFCTGILGTLVTKTPERASSEASSIVTAGTIAQ
jgi:hypothetical protein